MKTSVLAKENQNARRAEQAQADIDTLIQAGTLVMGGFSALAGIWAVSCFLGGLISAGGPVKLAYSWFMAANGLQ